MKKTLTLSKKLLTLALVIAGFTFAANVQSAEPKWEKPKSLSLTGIGTTAGGATTTCTNLIIDCRKFRNVTLQTKFNFADATTSNVVYTITKSVDKVLWDTTGTAWTVAGNGTNDIVASTTVDTVGYGWIKLDSIQNTHASIVCTNKSIIYNGKLNTL